jgi:hypothetical protein
MDEVQQATWCMGNVFTRTRPLGPLESARIVTAIRKHTRRLWLARFCVYGELLLIAGALFGLKLGLSWSITILALATMPGLLGLVVGGVALKPTHTLVCALQKDLREAVAEVYGREEVVRLPCSGVALVLYGNLTEMGFALPTASGPPREEPVTYPARFEWRPERSRFALCRRLTSTELAELELLRRRIANRHVLPTIAFFTFGALAIAALMKADPSADPFVPYAVIVTGMWFVWQLSHDLYVSARLSREHAVVTDNVKEGVEERAVEVLPKASLVWTIDRHPAGWRF